MRLALSAALVLGVAATSAPALGQTADEAAEPSVQAVELTSDRRLLGGVLAGWSLGSVAVGSAMIASAGDDDFDRNQGIQHVAWGGIDLAIAVFALATSSVDPDEDNPRAIQDARDLYETILWINVALDVAYVVTGSLLWGLAEDDGLRGSGAGIVMQGGFLLTYDFAGALWVGR